MTRVEVDKIRFCDPNAAAEPKVIHTVEFSDERSLRHFITLWAKGAARGDPWAASRKLSRHHNREIYHREPNPWIPTTFPGMESQGWSKHYHIDLTRPPQLTDVEPYFDDIPDSIQDEIEAYFNGRITEDIGVGDDCRCC